MNGHVRGADVQDVPLWPACAGLSDGVMPPKFLNESRCALMIMHRQLEFESKDSDSHSVSTVSEIESALAKLSIEEKRAVRDWLDDIIEDQLKVTDEFRAKIARAKQEIAAGVHSRVRQSDPD
jgi:hypothetical protein